MKQILINVLPKREVRVAVVNTPNAKRPTTLLDLHVEQYDRQSVQGNIYRAKVSAVRDELDGAFLDFGEVKQGLLPLSRIEPLPTSNQTGESSKRSRMSDHLKVGDELKCFVRFAPDRR